MKIAICPGSFDPITNGHLDVIQRAGALFDKVIVCVGVNPDKHPAFTAAERVKMIQTVCADMPFVQVCTMDGLLVDFAAKVGACAMIKGLRAVSDFEYEFQMALANKRLNSQIETVFVTTDVKYMYLSSSLVKQIASFGGDISDFVPAQVCDQVRARLCKSERSV